MKPRVTRFALIGWLIAILCVPGFAASQGTKDKSNPPAASQKASKQTTHSTKGTIASINADTLVLKQTVRGKAQQLTLTLNSRTQETGELVPGNNVTVQYREEKNQKIATAVREAARKTASKPAKVGSKPAKKS